ncbi:MAG: hypothetical protein F4Z84_13820 [Gammaproteobacteria bacterium]|nr:hypothetical protein [Gammaproteobacteria bacterium]
MVLVQKDDNYLTFTLSREARGHFLKLMLAEPGTAPRELRRASVDGYGGNIHLHLESKGGRYRFGHSLDGGATSVAFVETSATHALSRGYTGAYLGVYATGNGQETGSYADFDWVRYRAFERN